MTSNDPMLYGLERSLDFEPTIYLNLRHMSCIWTEDHGSYKVVRITVGGHEFDISEKQAEEIRELVGVQGTLKYYGEDE